KPRISGVSGTFCKSEPVMSGISVGSPLSGLAVIVAEHPSESLTPFDIHTALEIRGDRPQQSVVEALMVAFTVIMHHVLPDCVLKRYLSEEDHSVQTLFFYGTHEPLCESIQVRTSWRESNDIDALADEEVAELRRVFRVPVENQVPLTAKKTIANSR